jgi:phosphoribosylglycinamide formyltransferase 1
MEKENKVKNESLINIAIFASGAGSNAQNIIHYFQHHPRIKIALIVCNNAKAGVIAIAEKERIPLLMIQKDTFLNTIEYLSSLQIHAINAIVLAGFLWKIPPYLVQAFPHKILNIHPALLPQFGGKGMYGIRVHEAVINQQAAETGITIHYVDELYDHGAIVFQSAFSVSPEEQPQTLALKVHALEHKYYPVIIEQLWG